MTAQNKALIILVAAAAFIAGWLINSARVDDKIDTTTLLSAQLLDTQQQPIVVESQLKKLNLVNFWASWCAPCREEMPIFQLFYQQHQTQGFQVLGIAIDNREKTQPMLDSMAISYPVLYAQKTGMSLMEKTGNPQGLLPYTLLLDEKGRVLEAELGRINEQQLKDWATQYLGTAN